MADPWGGRWGNRWGGRWGQATPALSRWGARWGNRWGGRWGQVVAAPFDQLVIDWHSRIIDAVWWKDRRSYGRGKSIQQLRWPARKLSPHRIENVVRDPETDAIADLTDYTIATLLAKPQDGALVTLSAQFGSRPAGEVFYPGYKFPTAGDWTLQFKIYTTFGDAVYGDPVRVTVAENLDDLDAEELPVL
jgi:hypothetical protein